MTALALELTRTDARAHQGDADLTLEAAICRAWEGLSSGGSVACPACGEEMAPRRHGSIAFVLAGGCRSCGARLT